MVLWTDIWDDGFERSIWRSTGGAVARVQHQKGPKRSKKQKQHLDWRMGLQADKWDL